MALGERASNVSFLQHTNPNRDDDSTGFFNYISQQFGDQTVQLLRQFSKINDSITRQKNRRIFLLRCKSSNLEPTFVNFRTQHISFKCKYLTEEFTMSLHKFKRTILNLTISDTCKNLSYLDKQSHNLRNKILRYIPPAIFSNFVDLENRRRQKLFNRIKQKNIKKINTLNNRHHTRQNNNLLPNNNYIENLSNTPIPNFATQILSLGPKFSLPLESHKQLPVHDIIASVETALREQPTEIANDVRAKVTSTINNHKNRMKSRKNEISYRNTQLLDNSRKTKTFLKDNPHLIIAQSDKSNKTVVMESTTYNNKCLELLNDENTYKEIKTDPTNVTQNKNNSLIKEWKSKGYITDEIAKKLTIHNSHPPKFYALVKTHKPNMPVRPIVSNNQTPLYNLSKFLANSIGNIVGQNEYFIKNSFEFKHFINTIQLPTNYILISLDVISLYTNIPINLVRQIIDNKWHILKDFTPLPKDEFQRALDFTLTTNFFQFRDTFYKQLDGVAMGSPISSVIAQLVMEHAEKQIIDNLKFRILFYKRYVDDCILAIPQGKEQEVLDAFNAFHSKLQFTIETEQNQQINFLDLTLIRENGIILSKWYTKSVASGRYLNFYSQHHMSHKNSVIIAVIDRAIKLTSPVYREETIHKAQKLLIENNYPTKLINKIVRKRIHAFYNTLSHSKTRGQEPPIFFSLPYVSGLSEKIGKIFKYHNIKTTFKSQNHVKKFFSKLKSQTPKMKQTHLVYKIPCLDCNSFYIGQTIQHLGERIKAHKYAKSASTALTKHKEETGHNFNFPETSILVSEKNTFKRSILEMIHINLEKNSINNKSEINNLSKIYQTLFN